MTLISLSHLGVEYTHTIEIRARGRRIGTKTHTHERGVGCGGAHRVTVALGQ